MSFVRMSSPVIFIFSCSVPVRTRLPQPGQSRALYSFLLCPFPSLSLFVFATTGRIPPTDFLFRPFQTSLIAYQKTDSGSPSHTIGPLFFTRKKTFLSVCFFGPHTCFVSKIYYTPSPPLNPPPTSRRAHTTIYFLTTLQLDDILSLVSSAATRQANSPTRCPSFFFFAKPTSVSPFQKNTTLLLREPIERPSRPKSPSPAFYPTACAFRPGM